MHPTQLIKWRAIALQGLPTLFEGHDDSAALKAAHEQQLNALYAEIGRLTTQVAWLKKNLASSLTRSERVALVDRAALGVPLVTQANLLSLSRSSLYYRPRGPSAADVALKHRIDEIYTAYPFYGSRRIAVQLRREGFVINRKAVQRHMREMLVDGSS